MPKHKFRKNFFSRKNPEKKHQVLDGAIGLSPPYKEEKKLLKLKKHSKTLENTVEKVKKMALTSNLELGTCNLEL